jgi:hypothetical protein
MSERPATRADLRAHAWRAIRYGSHAPAYVDKALKMLWALDADEVGDAAAARYVEALLRHSFVEANQDGRLLRVRWRKPEPVHEP